MKQAKIRLVATIVMIGFFAASQQTLAQEKRMRDYRIKVHTNVEKAMKGVNTAGLKCEVELMDSRDRKGQDVEIRLTMPIEQFMKFAPTAALEAAAVPHRFDTAHIYLVETTTRRVGRIRMKDAEPIAGRYLAGDKEGSYAEMKEAIIWH